MTSVAASDGDALEQIGLLVAANRRSPDPEVERQLVQLRHHTFGALDAWGGLEQWPVPPTNARPLESLIPTTPLEHLDVALLRQSIAAHGCLRVDGLLAADVVDRFVQGIDSAFDVLAAGPDSPLRTTSALYSPLPLTGPETQSLGRHWIHGAGGLLTADSPTLCFQLLEAYEEIGLRRLATEYLGERPILSANKCTLRRVPLTAGSDWHQDGAFLGSGIRALNIWVALTDCGLDAPGLDVVPRRLDAIVETGTKGAIFDWAVGAGAVEELTVDVPVQRPVFRAGDALLFDDLFLHRTAIDPAAMTRPRYAIETWCFARTGYPDGQVPIVW